MLDAKFLRIHLLEVFDPIPGLFDDVERGIEVFILHGDHHPCDGVDTDDIGPPLLEVGLVVFPFGDQLREEYLERDREYVTMPQRKLAAICERLGIPCLDLFEDLDRDRHLMEDRIHLTAEGRGEVAEDVAGFLVEHGLVPPAGSRKRKPE